VPPAAGRCARRRGSTRPRGFAGGVARRFIPVGGGAPGGRWGGLRWAPSAPSRRTESTQARPVVGADGGLVDLPVHSSYSLLEGALTISRLAELAKADRQPALALTDTDNMFGALEFSDKLAGYGIQPIIGAALALDFADGAAGASTPAAGVSGARVATRPAPPQPLLPL